MSDHAPEPIGIDGVFVSAPKAIGEIRHRPVTSAIGKTPVSGELALTLTHLGGDDQADRVNHGGPDKAVYVYPGEHYPAWSAEGVELGTRVGENLTCRGIVEAEVRIGERWRWGDALLQVSQPRSPCYKLAMHTSQDSIIRRMIESGRCGWYLRVLTPGRVPTQGTITVMDRPRTAPTVAEAFAAMFKVAPGHQGARVERVIDEPALSEQWRGPLVKRRAASTSAGSTS